MARRDRRERLGNANGERREPWTVLLRANASSEIAHRELSPARRSPERREAPHARTVWLRFNSRPAHPSDGFAIEQSLDQIGAVALRDV